jgi:hypothetical protein
MWNLSQVWELEIDEAEKDIFNRYKYALAYIGVDFDREDVQDTIVAHLFNLETAFQTTIAYWVWKKKNHEEFEYPNAFFIDALRGQWKPINWKDEYMDNPDLKSPCQRWWEKSASVWGTDVRNQLVADVCETDSGYEYILFRSEKTLPLRMAKVWGWQRVLEYAQATD